MKADSVEPMVEVFVARDVTHAYLVKASLEAWPVRRVGGPGGSSFVATRATCEVRKGQRDATHELESDQ